MKQCCAIIFILFFIIPQQLAAQEIIYSDYNNEDTRDINFEILGKMNGAYVIYKSVRWKHMLAVYDDNMRMTKSIRLKFVPDKTFNIDFVTYPDHFYVIYQYQKNGVVYCKAAKLDAEGKKLTEPVDLDTTRIGILADNKIYNTVYSQDKQRILVYKMPRKDQHITVAAKLFDADMKLLDSTRYVTPFDYRRDIYSDIVVDNDGNFTYTRESKTLFRNKISGLEIVSQKPGAKEPKIMSIDLKKTYIDDAVIKVDNLNKHYIFNSFFSEQDPGPVKGLFTTIIDAVTMDTIRSAFNFFADSVRVKANSDGQFKTAFDDFFIHELIVKKDGGFIVATEDQTSQSRSIPNSFNRNNYYYNSPNFSSNDFYLNNPGYGYYRPYSSNSNWQDIRYFNDNILVLSLDNKLNMQWNTIIPKTQADDEVDNFLSFSTMNVGAEIHFLYNEDERRQIIGNHGILPDGEVKRYPTLKSREAGYEFMPRLAKQVGYREMIVPCVYRSNIAFAKVIFTE